MNRFPGAVPPSHSPFFQLDLITRFHSGDSRSSFFPFHRSERSSAVPDCSNTRFQARHGSLEKPRGTRNCCARVSSRDQSAPVAPETLKTSFCQKSIRFAPLARCIYIIKSFEYRSVPLLGENSTTLSSGLSCSRWTVSSQSCRDKKGMFVSVRARRIRHSIRCQNVLSPVL